jgi:polyisoprenoid-binding protein YceI
MKEEVMFFRRTLITLAATLIMVTAAMAGDTYKIDPVHSRVGFMVKHLVISNVRGNFVDFSGTIIYDPIDLAKSSVDVSINAASINTDNPDRDKHLKSPDFFDVEKFPEITFKSDHIEKKGEKFVAVGKLTMRGVTKEVTIPFDFLGTAKDPQGNLRIGFEGATSVNRQDYGISWNKALDNGGVLVGDEVKIDLSVEAVKQP